ncbi:MAG TPA: AMP nucleosidase [Sphingomicrobium sp.]|nr:AMP nucleosidase [Sphingomicrobium sp.]
MKSNDISAIVDQLCSIYDQSVASLRDALAAFCDEGRHPDPIARAEGAFAYPELRVTYSGERTAARLTRAFARLTQPGTYACSVARPALFRDYLRTQLEHLITDYGVDISVGRSRSEIPYPYVLDGSVINLDDVTAAELSRWFPSNELAHIGDEIADGVWDYSVHDARPLALFDGPRTDFSLARLRHYTGTDAEDFQHFILFTNYVRYVDEFVRFGVSELRREGSPYTALSVPGSRYERGDLTNAEAQIAAGTWRRHQMPAYHLIAEGRAGITLVNIGVGPSNAKTICDHVAVLRPEVWLLIGHCGGLRPTQRIGDYVLAHAYLRDDHVLDDVLPVEIPLPAIAEVQKALFEAAVGVTGGDEDSVKTRLRTGTVVTTDDRNWELRFTQSARRFNQSRAVAIDMESATVAAQGYRFRVPYGTLLCVSDKPIHGELKLPGQANDFYETSIGQHLRIGIETLGLLLKEGEGLHSRKLRSFDEPPLR